MEVFESNCAYGLDTPCENCVPCLWHKVGELSSDIISAHEARDAAQAAETELRLENERLHAAVTMMAPDWVGVTSAEIAECLKDCHSEFGTRFVRAREIIHGTYPVPDLESDDD